MTPEQIAKLPKWAQSEVKSLNHRISNLEKENESLKSKNPKSNVSYQMAWDGSNIFLPDDRDIKFSFNEGEYIQARLESDKKGGLCFHVRGSDSITLSPGYSNTVDIVIRK